MNASLGENLIFLISLPRSGSTLLQHILAGHSTIAATAEPWVLFPASYALRPQALDADYNANIGQIALTEFLAQLDGGEAQYYVAVRKMALHLYSAFLTKHNKERFLDKTSRYYLILPELFQIFPKARYVFLLRNPLAVLASFLESMIAGKWGALGKLGIRNDLLDGYRLLQQGIRHFDDDAVVLKYEELVTDPESTIQRLCQQLCIKFEPEMLHYGQKVGVLPGKLVDPKSIHKHQTVVGDYVDAWRCKFTTQQERHFAQAFLAHLGAELIDGLGYAYAELADAVSEEYNGWLPLVSWELVTTPPARRNWLQRCKLNLAYVIHTWQKRGAVAALKQVGRGGKKVVRRFLRIKKTTSSNHRVVSWSQLTSDHLHGWQAPLVAERQFVAYRRLLAEMYRGNPRQDFVVAAQALSLTNLSHPTVLEIGCGNGYYSEVLSHLGRSSIRYIGLDYSRAMIESARHQYPDCDFILGDATMLPVADNAYDIVWSGTILMHLVDYSKAIAETCRVARQFCVFHSTPVLVDRPTVFLSKNAYGTPVAEVIVNQAEFESLVHDCGWVIRHVLPSLPYKIDNVVKGTVRTLTYVCENRR